MEHPARRAVIVQQVPHEGAGIIAGALRSEGRQVEQVMAFRGDRVPARLEEDASLIVLGGPMGVGDEDKYPWLKDELNLIEYALKNELPVLGICLGAQLMARAAGARVYKGSAGKEIGWYPLYLTEQGKKDPLFLGLPDEFPVFQWHGDTFDLPRGAERLAKSDLYPNQLVRMGKRAYAMQFHLEVTEDMVSSWLNINEDEIKELKGLIDPKRVATDTTKNLTSLHRYGSAVFSRFLRL